MSSGWTDDTAFCVEVTREVFAEIVLPDLQPKFKLGILIRTFLIRIFFWGGPSTQNQDDDLLVISFIMQPSHIIFVNTSNHLIFMWRDLALLLVLTWCRHWWFKSRSRFGGNDGLVNDWFIGRIAGESYFHFMGYDQAIGKWYLVQMCRAPNLLENLKVQIDSLFLESLRNCEHLISGIQRTGTCMCMCVQTTLVSPNKKKIKGYKQNQDDDLLILSMRPTLLHHLHYLYIYQATPHVLLGVS